MRASPRGQRMRVRRPRVGALGRARAPQRARAFPRARAASRARANARFRAARRASARRTFQRMRARRAARNRQAAVARRRARAARNRQAAVARRRTRARNRPAAVARRRNRAQARNRPAARPRAGAQTRNRAAKQNHSAPQAQRRRAGGVGIQSDGGAPLAAIPLPAAPAGGSRGAAPQPAGGVPAGPSAVPAPGPSALPAAPVRGGKAPLRIKRDEGQPGGAFFVARTLRPVDAGPGPLRAAGAGARADGDRPRDGSRSRRPDARGDVDETSPSRRGAGSATGAAAEPLLQPLEGGPLEPVGAIPPSMQWIVTAIGGLAALALGAGLLAAWRARRGERRRRALREDIGLLQTALLPPVAARVGALHASVAYRPWDGPGAGGDFYDVFALPGGRAGVVLGDVEGHGRDVIGATAALRHSLRAYLEAGLEPRAALELAGEVLGRDPAATMATAVLAVHDPRSDVLTWAGAGHPPPILLGDSVNEPLTAAAAPPLGAATATGLRQTSVHLPRGSAACFFSDGLIDARAGGGRLGLDRLAELANELGDRLNSSTLLDAVAREASEIIDDMAVCVLRPAARPAGEPTTAAPQGRVEELALPPGQISTSLIQRFLWACGVEADEALAAMSAARVTAREGSGVLLRVETEGRTPVEISELGRATLAPVS